MRISWNEIFWYTPHLVSWVGGVSILDNQSLLHALAGTRVGNGVGTGLGATVLRAGRT